MSGHSVRGRRIRVGVIRETDHRETGNACVELGLTKSPARAMASARALRFCRV